MDQWNEKEVLLMFSRAHLPGELAAVVQPFAELAESLLREAPGTQRGLAFAFVLLAKDAAVRARLHTQAVERDAKARGEWSDD